MPQDQSVFQSEGVPKPALRTWQNGSTRIDWGDHLRIATDSLACRAAVEDFTLQVFLYKRGSM